MPGSSELDLSVPGEGRVALSAHHMLDLAQSPEAWLVERGEVLVFAVGRTEGGQVGRRHLLCSVGVGEIGFGSTSGHRTGGMSVIVTGAGETLIRATTREELSRWYRADEEPDPGERQQTALEGAIETWVTRITGRLGGAAAPTGMVTLPEQGRLRLPDAAAARPERGVQWAAVENGGLSFLGVRGAVSGSTDPPMAVSWRGEILALGDTDVDVLATAALERSGGLGQALAQFLDVALLALEYDIARVDADRALHRAAALAQGVAAGESAVSSLASVLPSRRPLEVGTRSGDTLVAALRLVAKAMGVELDPGAAPVEEGDVDQRIRAIADLSRCRARYTALPSRWWRADCGPLLGFLADDRRPVALLPRRGRYELIDPGAGTTASVDEALAQRVARYGYVINRRLPLGPRRLIDVFTLGLKGTTIDLSRVVVLGILAGLASLATPIVSKVIFDSVVPQHDVRRLLGVVLTLVLIAAGVALASILQGVGLVRARTRFTSSAQTAVWDRLLRLPAGFFQRYAVGELVSRAESLDAVDNLLSDATIAGLLSGLFALFNVFLMLTAGLFLAVVGIGMISVQVAVVAFLSYRNIVLTRAQLVAQNRAQTVTFQLIRGIAKLKVAGAEPRAFAAWAARFLDQRRVAYSAGRLTAANAVFGVLWPTFTTLAIVGGVVAAGRAAVSPGDYMLFTSAFTQSSVALNLVAVNTGIIALCVPLLEQLRPVLEAPVEVDTTREPPARLKGEIDLSHVSFRYSEEGALVLDDVSLSVAPGELVALVGPSGAGKSSVLRLLLGFEVPSSGTVSYDGRDLAGLDVTMVRRQIGTVIQGAQLLPGTVFSNLAGGRRITRDQAWAAAEGAGLADDIRAMPMGMETVVSEAAGTLSGGQRQRLLIARTLVSGPRVLLFDEATSALDNVTQATVSESINRLGITRVVIAHRLSTIEAAQRVYVLDRGRVVQQGSVEELRRQPGLFAEMVRRQLVE
jgi:NHLM bacteriocin system ABC transporter ATP-binding protein